MHLNDIHHPPMSHFQTPLSQDLSTNTPLSQIHAFSIFLSYLLYSSKSTLLAVKPIRKLTWYIGTESYKSQWTIITS